MLLPRGHASRRRRRRRSRCCDGCCRAGWKRRSAAATAAETAAAMAAETAAAMAAETAAARWSPPPWTLCCDVKLYSKIAHRWWRRRRRREGPSTAACDRKHCATSRCGGSRRRRPQGDTTPRVFMAGDSSRFDRWRGTRSFAEVANAAYSERLRGSVLLSPTIVRRALAKFRSPDTSRPGHLATA